MEQKQSFVEVPWLPGKGHKDWHSYWKFWASFKWRKLTENDLWAGVSLRAHLRAEWRCDRSPQSLGLSILSEFLWRNKYCVRSYYVQWQTFTLVQKCMHFLCCELLQTCTYFRWLMKLCIVHFCLPKNCVENSGAALAISQQSCERNPSRSRGTLEDRVRQECGMGSKRCDL